MIEISKRIFVGSLYDCFTNKEGWAVVHACKHPCHQNAVGYSGSLPSTHPNYLVLEEKDNLYLNIIDPPRPLFMMALFTEFLRFTRTHCNEGKNVLIHCNQGDSRAPSLALIFLAKELDTIKNESYEKAKVDFMEIYPKYLPGRGIQTYLSKHWEEIQ